jgi:hypothetical protein
MSTGGDEATVSKHNLNGYKKISYLHFHKKLSHIYTILYEQENKNFISPEACLDKQSL